MKKHRTATYILMTAMVVFLSGCGGGKEKASSGTDMTHEEQTTEVQQSEPGEQTESGTSQQMLEEKEERNLQLKIGDTAVVVAWEENESVEALKKLCEKKPLTIQMSMYGGFEQVGPIGTGLPSNDVQTTTTPGDIVLYSGNQMVVFYGSNTWEYTMLGHITDQDKTGMTDLLNNGDVTITITVDEI